MTTAIIFSRNRPAQLDLLLRSLKRYGIPVNPVVLYRDDETTRKAYVTCHEAHPSVCFLREHNHCFKNQLELLLAAASEWVLLLCDDDVFYDGLAQPTGITARFDVFCFQTRLGKNTTYCYPLDQEQEFPNALEDNNFYAWNWISAQHDFGYPGSIDGSFFRSRQLLEMLRGSEYHNPNTLEEAIQRQALQYHLPLICCYEQSSLVGMPLNRVNTTHPNRHEDLSLNEIDFRYVCGEQISLSTVVAAEVNAAHTPFELKWEAKDG